MSLIGSPRTAGRGARERTPAKSGPTLSVVIISTGERADLQRALGIVEGAALPGCEVVVVRSKSGEDLRSLAVRSGAVFVRAPSVGHVADLRERGIREASGDVVVLREDRWIHDASWLERWAKPGRPTDVEVPVPTVADTVASGSAAALPRQNAVAASG